jgi:hypothetical protein
MQEYKPMTLHEQLQIGMKAIEMEKQGKIEEATRLTRSIPLSPTMAKFAKDYMGADFLIQGGWNLSEAEAKFGPGWLNK